jgi:hypothetical protein
MKKPLFSRIGASSFVSSLFASQTIDRAFVALSVIHSERAFDARPGRPVNCALADRDGFAVDRHR